MGELVSRHRVQKSRRTSIRHKDSNQPERCLEKLSFHWYGVLQEGVFGEVGAGLDYLLLYVTLGSSWTLAENMTARSLRYHPSYVSWGVTLAGVSK